MPTKPELKELGDFLKPYLAVPVGDKTYKIPPISAKNALVLQESMSAAAKDVAAGVNPNDVELASDEEAATYLTRVLGTVYQEMLDADEPFIAIQHVAAITMAWCFSGLEKAQEYYRAGGKVQAARPQDRKPKTATRTRTGAATTTRKQG